MSDDRRNVTAKADPLLESLSIPDDERQRFRIFRLCECQLCDGTGKANWAKVPDRHKCPECRGEGKVRQEIATCQSPEAVGVALVTLGREGEFEDCPIGILDSQGEKGKKWIVKPWLPSKPRSVSDAGRVLASARKGESHGS